MRYPRRTFLGQVAVAPFAAGATFASDLNAPSQSRSFVIGPLPMQDEASLAKEVDALIAELPSSLRYRRVPVPAERNAWPAWEEAGKAYQEHPLDDQYEEWEERYRHGDPNVPDAVKRQFAEWLERNRECRRCIQEGVDRGALELLRSEATVRLSLAMDEISLLRNLARVEEAHSSLCLNRNDIDGAIASANVVMRMGMIQMQAELPAH